MQASFAEWILNTVDRNYHLEDNPQGIGFIGVECD